MLDLEKVNNAVKDKTKQCVARLQARQDELGMKHESNSLKRITTSQTNQQGLVHRIRFKFKKSGIYVHKGVGRGTKASQAGTTNRTAKEWFNPIVEEFADELTDMMADEMIEVTFDKLKIR